MVNCEKFISKIIHNTRNIIPCHCYVLIDDFQIMPPSGCMLWYDKGCSHVVASLFIAETAVKSRFTACTIILYLELPDITLLFLYFSA